MNWSVVEQMGLYLVITLLKGVIKSPSATKEEGSIIAQVAQLSTQADTAVNGTGWSSSPAPAAAAPAATAAA